MFAHELHCFLHVFSCFVFYDRKVSRYRCDRGGGGSGGDAKSDRAIYRYDL